MLSCQLFLFPLLSPVVPAPTVDIVPVGEPINGTLYNLSCTVRVIDSVNTGVSISSEWLLANEPDNSSTISIVSEEVVRLEQRHNLTFTPLRGADAGEYVCRANITPSVNTDFIVESSGNESYFVTVESKTLLSCASSQSPPLSLSLFVCVCRSASSHSKHQYQLNIWSRREWVSGDGIYCRHHLLCGWGGR